MLHPRLAQLPLERRRAALREANREPFDPVELVTLAAAIVFASWLAASRLFWLPVILVAVALVLARRWRRGLRRILEP